MKIKTTFNIILFVVLGFISIMAIVEAVSSYEIKKVEANDEIMQKIQSDISVLKSITYDYLETHQKRAEIQWFKKLGKITENAGKIIFYDDESKRIYNRITVELKLINTLFNEISLNHTNFNNARLEKKIFYQKTEKRLEYELIIAIEEMTGNSILILDLYLNNLKDTRNIREIIIMAALLSFGLLTLSLVYILSINILSSIKCLSYGINIIDSGELSHQIPLTKNAEMNNIIKIFNKMTQKLNKITRDLTDAKYSAEKSNLAKSQFLANMSHEIRNPLNGIIGMSSLLNKSDLNGNQKIIIDALIQSSNNLLTIINDILDLSKIESGKMELSIHDFAFSELVENIKSIFSIGAEKKGLDFIIESENGIPQYLTGDEGKICQVLINLIGNAIKFTEKGVVSLNIKKMESTDNSVKIQFSVKDTGIGISKKNHKELFAPFMQEDTSYSKKYQGTGLGLAISKRLVNLMNGEIWYEDNNGAGSIFSFYVHLEYKNQINKVNELMQLKNNSKIIINYKDIKILIVEDSEINRKTIQMILEAEKIQFDVVLDGKKALDICNKSSYSLILLDIQLPEISGVEVLNILKNTENKNNKTPIIAVTGYAVAGDKEKFLNKGFDGYLSKPFLPEELIGLINEILINRRI